MDGRRARLIDPVLDRLPRIPMADREAATASSRWAAFAQERMRVGWALVLGLGWPLVFGAGQVLEPAPADPEAAAPILAQLASLVLLAGLVATAVLAANGLRVAAAAGGVTGVVATAMVVACPVSGHHAYGAWWFAQMAIVTTMLAVSLAALGRRATAS